VKRILYVCNVAWFFVSHRLAHAVAARQAGYEVHVAGAPDRLVRLIEAEGIAFHPVPFDRSGGAGIADLLAYRALRALYASLRPDLVHHVTMKPILLGSWAARAAGVPATVNAVSGLGTLFLAEGSRAMMRRSVVLSLLRPACRGPRVAGIFQNEDDRAAFVGAGIFDLDRTVLIPGAGVDLQRFHPSPEATGMPLVVLPARVLRDKGVVEFVEAARTLAARGVRARFALVGGHDPHNASALSLSELDALATPPVEWWGQREDMPEVFTAAHIVCLPSYREGLPKALAEAAAAGRAIVTTDVPGCRDVVRHGVNGLLVPPRDADALARALEQLLSDPAMRQRFGRMGRARAEARLGLEAVIGSTLDLYQRMLGT
jgi:glycosyltransferase involved in cell wall biosynthesis